MPYGPYRYQNGNRYTYGADGRWWIVTSSHGGDDFGYPVTTRSPAHHPHHHAHALPTSLPTHHRPNGASRRVGSTTPQDPDDLRIRQLATAINHQAGWIGTGQGIAGFYAASLAGAIIIVSAPEALLEWNRVFLGAARGRVFWSGYRFGALRAAQAFTEEYAGRVISGSGIGIIANEYAPERDDIWRVLSQWWAYGSEGPVDAFIASEPGKVWLEVELPRLWTSDGFTRLLKPAIEIIYHQW